MSGSSPNNMMIRIDGDRIKRLREEKGLTQLYVATAVQVTTDTISRWENKRYPTIKKDNGIRLAEALEVELDHILDTSEEASVEKNISANTKADDSIQSGQEKPIKRSWLPLLLISLAVTILFPVYFWLDKKPPALQVTRFLPPHCIVGQPFPVALLTKDASGEQTAIIIKEQLPASVKLVTTDPPLPASSGKERRSIRWIGKADSEKYFIYLAVNEDPDAADLHFAGTFSVSSHERDGAMPIIGQSQIASATFHWADLDRDSIISDTEILRVYNMFGDLKPMRTEIDRIEEIWLGSGYRWNPEKSDYEIYP